MHGAERGGEQARHSHRVKFGRTCPSVQGRCGRGAQRRTIVLQGGAAGMNAAMSSFREDRSMPTRRSFVTGTLGAGAVLAAPGTHDASAQADRRMIVDAQVHLWKAESPAASPNCQSLSPSSGSYR